MCLYCSAMCTKDADGIANSVDPDQTAPLGAVWSGSALFAKTCPSEKFRSLRYLFEYIFQASIFSRPVFVRTREVTS